MYLHFLCVLRNDVYGMLHIGWMMWTGSQCYQGLCWENATFLKAKERSITPYPHTFSKSSWSGSTLDSTLQSPIHSFLFLPWSHWSSHVTMLNVYPLSSGIFLSFSECFPMSPLSSQLPVWIYKLFNHPNKSQVYSRNLETYYHEGICMEKKHRSSIRRLERYPWCQGSSPRPPPWIHAESFPLGTWTFLKKEEESQKYGGLSMFVHYSSFQQYFLNLWHMPTLNITDLKSGYWWKLKYLIMVKIILLVSY